MTTKAEQYQALWRGPTGGYGDFGAQGARAFRALLAKVCDVGVSGDPPYQTEDGTGGWAGDYWSPTYVAVEGDRVILGTCHAITM
jgi:hypothetical protein